MKENSSCKKSHHSHHQKEKLINRLSRIEGQVRGIKKMIDEDVYCDDILNQVSAVQSSISSFSRELLEHHLKSCVVRRIQQDDGEVVDELLKTFRKLMK